MAHTLAELARLLGRPAAVAEHLEEAVAVARSWQAPRWEAEALTSQARNR